MFGPIAGASTRAAGVFSFDRVVVATVKSRSYILGPADPDGFLEAVAMRTPQLQRKGSGLPAPLATPALRA